MMRSILLAPLCALLAASTFADSTPSVAGPSVREVVEFERILQPKDQSEDVMREQVSPDGTRAFIVTRKANVDSDKNRYRIQLLDLTPAHLASQRAPHPETVFSLEAAHDHDMWAAPVKDVRWHGDHTLVFLGRVGDEPAQVYRLDLPGRKLVQLTHEKGRIVSFAASDDLRRVVYDVQVPNPALREGQHAIVVENKSFWSVKSDQHDLDAQDRMHRYFVVDVGSPRPARALGEPFREANGGVPLVSISPDGRWALLPRYERDRLAAWASQYPLVDEFYQTMSRSAHVDPLRYFSEPDSYVARRLVACRLDDGREQTIVDAPDDARADSVRRGEPLWQGRGESVVLAGTFLPPGSDGKTPPSPHVIEYRPDSGRWTDIATLEHRLVTTHRLRDGFLVVEGTRRREFHRQPGGGWRESTDGQPSGSPEPAWTLHLPQGLNQPPDVYASGPSGQTTRLTELNPQFKVDSWGTMRPYTWRDAAGRQWDGGLMSTGDMDDHRPRPLLIQTYGFSPDRFYLDGPNSHEGYTSAFAGRAFLRDGILVLAMPLHSTGPFVSLRGKQNYLIFYEQVRSAIDALVKEGRVDPTKVGIMGWSGFGARVLNLLTFSDVPLRAATTADGDANTLFTMTVAYGSLDLMWAMMEEVNEGVPFGDGWNKWIQNDPALHTECVRTPLRIESYGPSVLPNWDVYAMLRRQLKPVEMVVIPGGEHSLLPPGDRMASLQGNVDWYGFWLAGKTRTTPVVASETPESLAAQYARWRQMETLKAADDARPRCVR